MAISSSEDPVQTLIDLLDNSTDSDYANTKPSIIEAMWENRASTRAAYTGDAIHVYAAGPQTVNRFGASNTTETRAAIVNVEVSTTVSGSRAAALTSDVVTILQTYALDNEVSTTFTDIWVRSVNDARQETNPRKGTQYRNILAIDLQALRTPGAVTVTGVTDSTDPVAQVKNVLDASSDNDYTGVKPGIVAETWSSSFKQKQQTRGTAAMYVHSPALSTNTRFGAGFSTYLDTETVAIDVFYTGAASDAYILAEDVANILFNGFALDNESETAWTFMEPVEIVDRRHESVDNRLPWRLQVLVEPVALFDAP